MAHALLSVVFSVAMGFVAAGICTSGYRLATNSRLKFERRESPPKTHAVRLALLVIGGPLVILRNAVLAVGRHARPRGWLVATTVLASGWSFCLGVAVINLLIFLGVAS